MSEGGCPREYNPASVRVHESLWLKFAAPRDTPFSSHWGWEAPKPTLARPGPTSALPLTHKACPWVLRSGLLATGTVGGGGH